MQFPVKAGIHLAITINIYTLDAHITGAGDPDGASFAFSMGDGDTAHLVLFGTRLPFLLGPSLPAH
jgi:hypothetical protein